MQYDLQNFIDSGENLTLSSFTWQEKNEYYGIILDVSKDITLAGWIQLKEKFWKIVLIKSIGDKKKERTILLEAETQSRNEGIALMDTFIKAKASKFLDPASGRSNSCIDQSVFLVFPIPVGVGLSPVCTSC